MKTFLCCCVLGAVALTACSDDLGASSATTPASSATSASTESTVVTVVETTASADPTTTETAPPTTIRSTTTEATPPPTIGSTTTPAAAPPPVITGVYAVENGDGTVTVNASAGTTTCQDRETWSFSGPVSYPTRDSGWGYHCWPSHSTTPIVLTPGTWTATLTIYLNGSTANASTTFVVG